MPPSAIPMNKYYNHDGTIGSTYNSISEMMAFYYPNAGTGRLSKAFTGYNDQPQAFNWKYGAAITLQMFNSDNALMSIGGTAYRHEGVRISPGLAVYGGMGTARDGAVPAPVKQPIDAIRQPFKELIVSYDYGLALEALEQTEDDTIQYDRYVQLMARTYANGLDIDLLRPTGFVQRTDATTTEEIDLTPLSRIFANASEIGMTYPVANSVAITEPIITPYGLMGGGASDMMGKRAVGSTNSYNSIISNAAGAGLALTNFRDLFYGNYAHWDGGLLDNKIWIISPIAAKIVDAERANNQRIITGASEVYVQRDINGVRTMPGMDTGGIPTQAMYGIPAIPDANLIRGRQPDGTGTDQLVVGDVGEVYLLDTNYLSFDMLTPVTVWSSSDIALLRRLNRANVIHSRGEIRCSKFAGSGKIVNAIVPP